MKGFIYTIITIVILAVVVIILLGRDGTTLPENTNQNKDTVMEGDTDTASTTPSNSSEQGDETATTTPSNSSGQANETTEADESTEADVVITLTGKNFAFSQEEVTVQKGDRVRIEFESTDGFHDWVVDAFDAATDRVQTGGTTSVEFVADTAGEFEYYCSVGSHRELGMVGTLVVEG